MRRELAAVAAVLVACLLLAGCGTAESEPSEPPRTPVPPDVVGMTAGEAAGALQASGWRWTVHGYGLAAEASSVAVTSMTVDATSGAVVIGDPGSSEVGTSVPWYFPHQTVVRTTGAQGCFECHEERWCSACHDKLAGRILPDSAAPAGNAAIEGAVAEVLEPERAAKAWKRPVVRLTGDRAWSVRIEAPAAEATDVTDETRIAIVLLATLLDEVGAQRAELLWHTGDPDDAYLTIEAVRDDAPDWWELTPQTLGQHATVTRR